MVTAGSFFAYCLAAEWLDRSPAANLPGAPTRGRRVRPDEEREAVSDADLALILGGEAFRQLRDGVGAPSRARQPEREAAARELYWAMLLLVYTGARRGEVAQLWPSDIDEVDGVPCVSIAPSGEKGAEKAVKSRAGVRLVPLHSDLLELGLLDYVAVAKRSGRRRLFPWAATREGERISKLWETLREQSGASRKATLHGLRHRFATHLKHAGVEEARIAQLLGHANVSLTTGRYGKRYDVRRLAETVTAVRNREELAELFRPSRSSSEPPGSPPTPGRRLGEPGGAR